MKALCLSFLIACALFASPALARDQWTVEQAKTWYKNQPWLIGCNFIPSTAVNTLEMWQAETYDPKTIDKELGFAQSIGFNVIRVFLHPLVWQQDPIGFKNRLENFLAIADSHKIRTILVFFDDCWNSEGKLGKQPDPVPGVHNSQWVKSPGYAETSNTTLFPVFEAYVKDLVSTYANDARVIMWDIYNEPGNFGNGLDTLPLITKAFQWARDSNPSQPLSSAWGYSTVQDITKIYDIQKTQSDVITFHSYATANDTVTAINDALTHERPAICTEYMARTVGSNFVTHVPIFHEHNVGAINWGLVKGKTNTIFPWTSPEGSPEPKIWFHDVFRPDGTPFSQEEIDTITKYSKPAKTPAFLEAF